MVRSPRTILFALVFALPVASWLGSNGGLPICCWGGVGCPSQAAMGASCPMGAGAGRACAMAAPVRLILPAPAVPVFPTPLAIGLAPPMTAGRLPVQPVAPPQSGWPTAVFHPPRSLAS